MIEPGLLLQLLSEKISPFWPTKFVLSLIALNLPLRLIKQQIYYKKNFKIVNYKPQNHTISMNVFFVKIMLAPIKKNFTPRFVNNVGLNVLTRSINRKEWLKVKNSLTL